MCGICGGLSWKAPLGAEALRRMTRTLTHRGPDDEGFFLAPPVALGVRRLAVIDLETGHQPVGNEDGSVQVVQNGEVYNHVELRAALSERGHRFRTKCDTEVLAHLYEERGEDFLAEAVGMFAVAVWDGRRERLLLARDRLGKKPLYYSAAGGALVFGSEIKAVLAGGSVSRELDHAALGEYLAKLYVSGAATIYREVRQVSPGQVLAADRGGLSEQFYWDLRAIRPRPGPFREAELVEELGALLRQAVRLRLRSDVPLGVFLSGGIDSSLVAALAAEAAPRVRTFTIGFEAAGYDESAGARALAAHIGSDHCEERLACVPDDVVRKLPGMFDQPFGDSSAVPTHLVARAARREITVALSGDGGDEVFGGYRRYRARRLAERWNRLPAAVRGAAGRLAAALGCGGGVYPGGLRTDLRRFTEYAAAVARDPGIGRAEYFTAEMQAGLLRPEVLEAVRSAAPAAWPPALSDFADPVERMIRRDLLDYLPGDILVKVDRASMAVGLEARAPLLDHRVAEFMLALPVEWKLRGRTGKYLLRKFARTVLPAEVLARPKHGFALPLREWFNPGGGGRRLLQELSGAGGSLGRLVRPEGVSGLLERHGAGAADYGEHLWALVMLGLWEP